MTIALVSIARTLESRAAHLADARRLTAEAMATLDRLDRKVIGYMPRPCKVRVAA